MRNYAIGARWFNPQAGRVQDVPLIQGASYGEVVLFALLFGWHWQERDNHDLDMYGFANFASDKRDYPGTLFTVVRTTREHDLTLQEGVDFFASRGMVVLSADTPEDIDKWPSLNSLFGVSDE